MSCINLEVIKQIKKEKNKYVILTVIASFLFCLSVALLPLITSREYEQLFIVLFGVVFTILINIIIYFVVEHIRKDKAKINLYEFLLSLSSSIICGTVIETMGKETYNNVVFNAYRIKDENNRISRILIPELFVLENNKSYEFKLTRSVVISYVEK